uniref:Uncharacterized protein n=1 Tax=Rhizophora mucronata TaxID=61149 RepID=A0A2P2QTT5_RHIMU
MVVLINPLQVSIELRSTFNISINLYAHSKILLLIFLGEG